MKEKTCCFTGHRNIPQKDLSAIKKRLENEIETLIIKDVIYFIAGGALGFDTLAAITVLNLRKKYSWIKLILAFPCKDQTTGWKQSDIDKYKWISSKADKIITLSQHYYCGCMHARNRYLVDHASYCISYLTKSTGGTVYTVDYAQEKGLKIIMI